MKRLTMIVRGGCCRPTLVVMMLKLAVKDYHELRPSMAPTGLSGTPL